MSCQDVRVGCNVVDRGTESVDITDRHGVREPFFFIIMCKSCQICVERCNWCLTVCHGFFCIITDYYEGESRRCGNDFLGTAAHNVDLPVGDTHRFAERSRYGIDNCHDAVFLKKRTDCGNIVQHTAWCISMDNGCVFVIMIFFKEVFEFLYVKCFTVISGVELRTSAVHGNKICKSFAIDAVVQNEDTVTWFGHGRTGGFQSEDSLSAEDECFVVGVEKPADLFAGFLIKFYEVFVKIRVGTFSAAGETHVFGNLCRARCHNFIHKIKSFFLLFF